MRDFLSVQALIFEIEQICFLGSIAPPQQEGVHPREGYTPSPHITLLGAFGASILWPLAFDVAIVLFIRVSYERMIQKYHTYELNNGRGPHSNIYSLRRHCSVALCSIAIWRWHYDMTSLLGQHNNMHTRIS